MPPFDVDLSRRAVLIDTNVLVAAFWPDDPLYEDTRTFLFEVVEGQLIVPMSVVVETWGMLVGSNKCWDEGIELLTWLNEPGNVTLIPQHVEHSISVKNMVSSVHIDCVDASLMYLADEVSEQCDLKPPILIATYDTADFVRCLVSHKLRFGVYFPDTLDKFFLQES